MPGVYGNIADVMAALGMNGVRGLPFRRVITRTITVKRAAQIHGVPVDDLMDRLNVTVLRIEADDLGADT